MNGNASPLATRTLFQAAGAFAGGAFLGGLYLGLMGAVLGSLIGCTAALWTSVSASARQRIAHQAQALERKARATQ